MGKRNYLSHVHVLVGGFSVIHCVILFHLGFLNCWHVYVELFIVHGVVSASFDQPLRVEWLVSNLLVTSWLWNLIYYVLIQRQILMVRFVDSEAHLWPLHELIWIPVILNFDRYIRVLPDHDFLSWIRVVDVSNECVSFIPLTWDATSTVRCVVHKFSGHHDLNSVRFIGHNQRRVLLVNILQVWRCFGRACRR